MTDTGRDAPPSRRAIAGILGTGPVVLALAATVLSWWWGVPVLERADFTGLYLLLALAWGPVGGLLVSRRAHPAGVVGLFAAYGAGVSAIAAQAAKLGPDALGPATLVLLDQVLGRLWLPGALAVLSIVALLVLRGGGGVLRVLVVAGAVASAVPFAAGVLRQRPGRPPNPFSDPTLQELLSTAFYTSEALAVAVGACAAVLILAKAVRGRGGPGVGWLAAGQIVIVVGFGYTFLGGVPGVTEFVTTYLTIGPSFAVLFLPAAVLLAALAQSVWGAGPRVNRTVAMLLITLAFAAAYIYVVILLTGLLPAPPTIVLVIATASLAILLGPFWVWVERQVDATVYGDAAAPAQLVRRLGAQLGGNGSDLEPLVGALRSTLRLARVEVHAAEAGDPERLLAADGVAAGVPLVIPLLGRGRAIGRLVVWNRGRLDRRTRAVLVELSGVLSVAAQLAAVNQQLAAARTRALGVAAEERGMIRRELRDGVAPGLGAAARLLTETLARLRAGTDSTAPLSEARAEVARRTAEVRDLARTLLPGALDAGDIDTALCELADRFTGERRVIAITADRTHLLEASGQIAVYHLVAELVLLSRVVPDLARFAVDVRVGSDAVRITARTGGPWSAPTEPLTARVRELGGRVGVAGEQLEIEVPT